jgi:hypothetical protein
VHQAERPFGQVIRNNVVAHDLEVGHVERVKEARVVSVQAA